MTTTLYGIKNCDTVQKALKWLHSNGHEHCFHDFRVDGLEAAQLQQWLDVLGWEGLINKRSTTWKQLSDAEKSALNDKSILDLILHSPTLIKRPLLDLNGSISVGFKAADYQTKFL